MRDPRRALAWLVVLVGLTASACASDEPSIDARVLAETATTATNAAGPTGESDGAVQTIVPNRADPTTSTEQTPEPDADAALPPRADPTTAPGLDETAAASPGEESPTEVEDRESNDLLAAEERGAEARSDVIPTTTTGRSATEEASAEQTTTAPTAAQARATTTSTTPSETTRPTTATSTTASPTTNAAVATTTTSTSTLSPTTVTSTTITSTTAAAAAPSTTVRTTTSTTSTTARPTTTTTERPTTTSTSSTTTTAPIPRIVSSVIGTPFATIGDVVLVHPASIVERIGYHESNHDGARQMAPVPSETQVMTLETRDRGNGSRTAADIVVSPDVPIVSPVTGTVKRSGSYTLYCDKRDHFVVIEPDARPGYEVKLLHIVGINVSPGDRVVAGVTELAPQSRVLPFASQVDEFTAEPSWPHVHIEVVDPTIRDRPGSGC